MNYDVKRFIRQMTSTEFRLQTTALSSSTPKELFTTKN